MRDHSSRLTAAAAVVIGLLTGSAFWLSYAHLHTVAAEHGLGGSEARAWAWPGCLDLFIVAGELLMLRASLSRRTDWWAIALTVVGSGGSIALNIAGVGTHAQPLDYVVAAVPPTAALLAFGALMRQVHDALSTAETPADQAFPAFAETGADQAFCAVAQEGQPSDLQFSRIRENAPAVGRGRPVIGPVRDSRSLTEGQPVPLSAVRDTASLTEAPAGPLTVGSLGDLTNGEGTHSVRTPGDLRGAANTVEQVWSRNTPAGNSVALTDGIPDHPGGTAPKGVQTVHTPEVPSAAVTESVTERVSTATDSPEEGVHTAHTPGDYRIGTPSDALDAVEDTADAPHPAASDAASGHPLPAEQRLPEVPSAGRTVPVLGPIPWPGLDGASVHPALHPAASAAGQTLTVSSETPADDVGPADPIPGPDAPDALPDADAPEAALIATARAVDRAARAETGRAASLRRLQAELRIGQPRAQQLQRILANA
ncbi:DUF2637 domain-containing protein [Kitasatospora indigofera]|uniref:DUF2637 domain-containing protein n=1 Tax=Kitasatospora indigofera TaxID=67307 RepID=UPI003F4B7300